MYQWIYGVPMSGLSFPLITASGTYAKNFDPAQLSGVISKNGGAWEALGNRLSGIPGDGVYTLAALSSTEMTAYSWIIKITANSGCMDQCIAGYNLSGFQTVNTSAIAFRVWNSLLSTYTSSTTFGGAVVLSGQVSATVDISAVAAQVWNSLTATYTSTTTFGGAPTDYSGIAAQVWNTQTASCTSTTTFGGAVLLSGDAAAADTSAIASQVWNTVVSNHTSSVTFGGKLPVGISGIPGIQTAVSGVVANVNYSSVAAQVWNSLTATYTSTTTFGGAPTDYSGVAAQVWNTVHTVHTSTTTFGGGVLLSGDATATADASSVAAQVWNSLTATYTSAATFGGVVMLSGNATATVNVSAIAAQTWNTLTATATSATTYGGAMMLSGNATATINISSIAAQVWNTAISSNTSSDTFGGAIMLSGNAPVASVNISSIAAQVWNSQYGVFTSNTTFGGMVRVSGLDNILNAISGLKTDVSGIRGIMTQLSGLVSGVTATLAASSTPVTLAGVVHTSATIPVVTIANNVSGTVSVVANLDKTGYSLSTPVSLNSSALVDIGNLNMGINSSGVTAIRNMSVDDADALTSGTLGFTLRALRWYLWEGMVIDKTYDPPRQYVKSDATNTSSWFSLVDTSNYTIKARGG